VLVNGNYENTYFALEGMDLALSDLPEPSRPTAVLINWWEQLTTTDLDEVLPDRFPVGRPSTPASWRPR
jgi:creatinine amidohydrolase